MERLKTKKLKDICSIKKGTQLSKVNMKDDGDFIVVNGGVEASGRTNSFNTEENTITISEGGNSCGFVNLINEKFWAGGHCYTLTDLKDYDKDYLFFVLKYKQNEIMKLRVGSGLPNIQKKDIENVEIPDISYGEQVKIGSLLKNIEEIIKGYQLLIKEKEQFIKSQFVEMFKNEKNIIKLIDVCNKVTDGSHNPPKGCSFETNWMMLSAQNIDNSGLNYDDIRFLSQEDFERENQRTNIQKGDLLFSIVGTIGKSYVVEDEKDIVFQRSVAVIKLKNDINRLFLKYVLDSEYVKAQIDKISKGNAQKGIYLNDLKSIKVPIPVFSKQNQFASIVELIDKQKFELEKQKQNYIELRKGLMQQLLTGKLKVS